MEASKASRGRPQSAPHSANDGVILHRANLKNTITETAAARRSLPEEERMRMRVALRTLDERDLESHTASWMMRQAASGGAGVSKVLVSELFRGMDASNVHGRKQRYRLARQVLDGLAWPDAMEVMPAVVKVLVRRATDERSAALFEEEGRFLEAVVDRALEELGEESTWTFHAIIKPMLDAIAKTLDIRKISGCCRQLERALRPCALQLSAPGEVQLCHRQDRHLSWVACGCSCPRCQ